MKTESMDVQEALGRGQALPFALVRNLSSVTLGPAPETVDLEELIEARFFRAGEEVRIFQGEAGPPAVRLSSEEGDITVEKECRPANPAFGESVTVRQVLDFDADGQAFVSCTLLTGWKGGR